MRLTSSEQTLVEGWEWAITQARSFVRSGDPVGDWIEASLPGRDAFCMRDVAHQSAGAQILGLRSHVKNMLRRFAEHVSGARDWCSFWEITGDNLPAAQDYTNDTDFWYNLPANFDVLAACLRQYRWTGDPEYIHDPVFVQFYDRTVTDYVQRWDMNGDGLLEHLPQYGRRGIGSYEEAIPDIYIGGDLLAAQMAAYQAYAHIQELRGYPQDALPYRRKAAAIRERYNQMWWNPDAGTFHSFMHQDGQFAHEPHFGVNSLAMYFDLVQGVERADSVMKDLMQRFHAANVETQSYFPELAYRYGFHAEAYAALQHLFNPQLPRRTYPEVSYAVLEAIVCGMIGLSAQADRGRLVTISRLDDLVAWVAVEDLPILDNRIELCHLGNTETRLSNQQGRAIIWKACFGGSEHVLMVDDIEMPATHSIGQYGQALSWVEISIPAGESRAIRRPRPHVGRTFL
jgi:mannosylglycerate hydrolase MGH1-like protein